MCAIAGIIDFDDLVEEKLLDRFSLTMKHRGPDDSGSIIFTSSYGSVGLSHRRLSIIDLNPRSKQPITFKHLTITFNGEIYNYLEIRKDLINLGYEFKTESDTEVILLAFDAWHMSCADKFIGMFAFAIFDSNENKLFMCRDRTGIKPLFYYWDDNLFLFASELKAFHQHEKFKKEINEDALSLFFRYGYIQAPLSIFKNCWKQEPGTWKIFDLKEKQVKTNVYWNVRDFYSKPILDIGYEEAKQKTEDLLVSAFNYRTISDVPVGLFLSGGYDSTAVAALLQKDSSSPISTFTIGFPDGVNEAPYAEKIAKYLGTIHYEYNCSVSDAKNLIPELPFYYDEPNGDSSSIPTILVSRLAKKNVGVALSADGGDEVFAGYSGYAQSISRLGKIEKAAFLGHHTTSNILRVLIPFLPQNNNSLHHQVSGIVEVLRSDRANWPAKLIEHSIKLPDDILNGLLKRGILYPNPLFSEDFKQINGTGGTLSLIDYLSTLSDLLLVKIDRASMSVSLESREPFMDHRIVEWSSQLPYEFKNDGKTGKLILKDIVHKYVPRELMERPKTGFDLPIYKWLKNELSFLLEEVLSPEKVAQNGFLNPDYVRQLVNAFKNNSLRHQSVIWRLIVFQMWYEMWMLNKNKL